MRSRSAIAVAIAAVLALVVAACGGGSKDGTSSKGKTDVAALKGQKVTLWIMNNGPHPVEDTQRILQPFEQRTGIDVDVQLVGWDVQFDRIRNAAVSGEGPDITQAGTTQVPFFAALGGFEDVSARIGDIGGSGAYAPGVWKTTQVVGQDGTYAVPWFTEARAIYYRKDALQKAGVDPSTAFSTWDSFRTTLEAINQKVPSLDGEAIQPFGSPGKKAFDLVHHVMPFVWDAGGAELNADGTKSAIDTPQAEQGVDFMARLIQDGLYDKSQLERDGTQVENQFKGGRLAVWMGGPWVLGSVTRADDDTWSAGARKNVGIAPMPAGPTGKGYTFVGGSNLMVFKSSKHKDAAWELVKYLSSDQVQRSYADLLGMFPARLSPQKQIGSEDANHEAFLKAIEQGRTYAPIPQWGQIENAYKTRFGNILDAAAGLGGKPLTAAQVTAQLQGAAKEADSLLAQGTS
jgi:multiple sugar transport system substrate-binding protein